MTRFANRPFFAWNAPNAASVAASNTPFCVIPRRRCTHLTRSPIEPLTIVLKRFMSTWRKPGSQRARGMIGYLSHNTALYLDLTALENLRFYARLLDHSGGDDDLQERITNVGLAGRGHEPVRNYSRGMQQRLAIARAFLHDPPILLLDEPFTGLDQEGTNFLRDYLNESRARGKTCLMAIHDEPLGYALADRLVVIEKGIAALDFPRQSVSLEEFQHRYHALTEER